MHVHCHDEAVVDVHNSAGSPKWRPDISLEVPHVRRPLVVSGDSSEPVKGTGTDMTRKSIQETERRNYTRYTWECVSALLLTERTSETRVKVRGCVRLNYGQLFRFSHPLCDMW